MRKKKQGSVGQRPATKQAHQNERRVKKKVYARREEDSNQNKTQRKDAISGFKEVLP